MPALTSNWKEYAGWGALGFASGMAQGAAVNWIHNKFTGKTGGYKKAMLIGGFVQSAASMGIHHIEKTNPGWLSGLNSNKPVNPFS